MSKKNDVDQHAESQLARYEQLISQKIAGGFMKRTKSYVFVCKT
jgi:hypothetical protein